MLSSVKQCGCLLLAAMTVLLSGCGAASSNEPETTAATAATHTVTQPPATVSEPVSAPVSTDDSAYLDEGDISYNTLDIKTNINEIETTLDDFIEAQHFMGALYAKIGNDFEYVKAKGFANQGTHIENSIYRSFYAGSITQLFTAVAVMKLQEEKKLSLDDTLEKYFSGCVYGKEVTIRQLLTMTSGIPDYLTDSDGKKTVAPDLNGKLTQDDDEKNKATILSWILSQPREKVKKGAFAYSESNYYLLGEIIGTVTQTPYEAYLAEAVFQPADMNKTGFEPDETTARPYDSREDTALLCNAAVGYSAAGVITNISDLLKFIDALLAGQIIDKAGVKEMLTDHGSGYGYGAYVRGSYVSCAGKTDAYSAKLGFNTDKSQIFAAMSNYTDADPGLLHRSFRNYLLKFRN